VPVTQGTSFDLDTRIYFVGDIAFRFIGDPDTLLREIRAAGFRVIEWRLVEAKSEEDVDTSLMNATK